MTYTQSRGFLHKRDARFESGCGLAKPLPALLRRTHLQVARRVA
jgi:hypothetical protein